MLSLIQAGDNYELRINNQVFSHIMTQSKFYHFFNNNNNYKRSNKK